MTTRVCLIAGVGAGTGAAIAKRFACAGYRVAMLARSGDRLAALEGEIDGSRAYACDIGDLDALVGTTRSVVAEMGLPDVVVHNAVSASFATFMADDPSALERNFRVNTTSLLYLAREVAPGMVERGSGAIIVTGNTAAHRGVPSYALFAPTKAAQRILAQALAKDLGPRRIHVGYVTIDAVIDSPWLGEAGEGRPNWADPPPAWPFKREDYFASFDCIAEEVYHIAHQHSSVWSFDHTIRPFAEKWS